MEKVIKPKFKPGDIVWIMYGSAPRRAEIQRIEYKLTEKLIRYGSHEDLTRIEASEELKYTVRVANCEFSIEENVLAQTFNELRDIVFKIEENEYL